MTAAGLLAALLVCAAARPAEDPLAAWRKGAAALEAKNPAEAARQFAAAAADLPKNPEILYALARAEALAGRPERSLTALGEVVALGFGAAAAQEPDFVSLRPLAKFQALLPSIARNAKPVSGSATAFTIPETDLIPEGIAWDPATGILFVGSLHKNKIVAVHPDGRIRDFVRSGQDGITSVLGMRVDPARRALWAASAEPDAPGGNPARRSALFRFDLATGGLLARHPSPPGGPHLFNDLVVTRGGDVYMTDSEAGAVYRLRSGRKELEAFAPPGRFVYPNGIALSPDERFLYVASVAGVTVWNLAAGGSFELASPADVTLVGIDGLCFHDGMLVAVQNGVEPARVAAFPLSPGLDRVTGGRVLERGHPLFEIPTTGVVANGTFFYLANAQLTALAPGNVVREPEKRKPVVILELTLPAH